MTKMVNIYPNGAITTINPPIRSRVMRVIKSTEEIRQCIIARAIVDEILSNGDTVRLDFSNYDKDNEPSPVEAAVSAAKENVKEEVPAKEEPTTKVDYSKPDKAVDVDTDMAADEVSDIEPADDDSDVETIDAESL